MVSDVTGDEVWRGVVAADTRASSVPGRQTFCSSSSDIGVPGSSGQDHFTERTARHFESGPSKAIDRLVRMKAELRDADTEVFWRILMQNLTAICNAQCAFVAKEPHTNGRYANDETYNGENKESSLQGVALYYNDGHSIPRMFRNYNRLTSDIPCALMGQDKIVLVPEKLDDFLGENFYQLPFRMEAYLAVPLFDSGKSFAHIGLMWTVDGLEKCDVSWAYLEMILHSLEDLILHRIKIEETQQNTFSVSPPPPSHPHTHPHPSSPRSQREEQRRRSRSKTPRYNSKHAATCEATFKPFARGLSHELRTPMQGVVGMLDVMHATVQENIGGPLDGVFRELRENIEATQDSSRRAIQAADNIVLAYDFNMKVPDTPHNSIVEGIESATLQSDNGTYDNRPGILIEGSDIPVNPYKRRRSTPVDWSYPSSPQQREFKSPRREVSPRTEGVKSAVEESEKIVHAPTQQELPDAIIHDVSRLPNMGHKEFSRPEEVFPPMALHSTKIRDLLQLVITESLHVGGRPDSAKIKLTDTGEVIEIRSRSSSGEASTKVIDWSVSSLVPEILFIDEKDLAKLVSCVFLNALKFTESGNITVKATLNIVARYVMINIKDTGTGIPSTFLPNLFKPFACEDGSTTRSKEGLGLGLLVAKSLSRRLGGDLVCVRSSTTGPTKGSEFEILLPIGPNETVSRPSTPFTDPSASSHHINFNPSSTYSEWSDSSTVQPGARRNGEQHSPPTSPPNRNGENQFKPDRVDMTQSISARRPSMNLKRTSFFQEGNNFDKNLAAKYPLTFLVAEDNKINRKILVSMLSKLGYKDVYEAFDGKEVVRIMDESLSNNRRQALAHGNANSSYFSKPSSPSFTISNGIHSPPPSAVDTEPPNFQSPCASKDIVPNGPPKPIDVVLMDLWMPGMDGYEATEKIFEMAHERHGSIADTNLYAPKPFGVLAVSADVTEEAIGRATKIGMEGYMTKPYKLSDLERLIVEFCRRHGRLAS